MDADRLSDIVAAHAVGLRDADFGPRFQLGDATFRLHARGRNTIYRVASRSEWFLKLPRRAEEAVTTRERIGADVIRRALGKTDEYAGASVIRVSLDPAYVLSATIPGVPLNRVVFAQRWWPFGAHADLESCFAAFGACTAALHEAAVLPPGTPHATTQPFARVAALLDGAAERSHVTDAIGDWYRAHHRSDAGSGFVHGNLRLDNVLKVGAQVGFIDFENCGTGSTYQDLSRPVTDLFMIRCAAGPSYRRATNFLQAFVSAYGAIRRYDPDELWDYIRVRVARYYLENHRRGALENRIGGLPVARRKLDRLTLDVMRRSWRDVVPELGAVTRDGRAPAAALAR